MSEILFLTISNKRTLSNILDIHTQRVIQQHRMLGFCLSSFRPVNNYEVKKFNQDLERFMSLKHELKENGFREFILKFKLKKQELLPIRNVPLIEKKDNNPKRRREKKSKYQHKQIEIKNVKIREVSPDIQNAIKKLMLDNEMLIGQLNIFNPNNEHDKNLAKIRYERYQTVQRNLREFCPRSKIQEWYTGVSYKLALDPSIVPLKRARVMAVLGEYCHECGSTHNLEIHHKIWQSRGGTDSISNLEILCGSCHDKVHGQIIEVGVTA